MSRRTKKGKSIHPRKLHAQRTRLRAHERYLKVHLKSGPKPFTELMAARIECHRIFDLLWQGPDAPLTRTRAYQYLQKITGMTEGEAHIAQFDMGVCIAVAEQVKADYPRLFPKVA